MPNLTSEQRTVRKDYDVDRHGIIHSPGKFEGEPEYVPYYWGQGLEGFADADVGDAFLFELSRDDADLFPDLAGDEGNVLILSERGDGFVTSEISEDDLDDLVSDMDDGEGEDFDPADLVDTDPQF